jgi:hypothetical protein
MSVFQVILNGSDGEFVSCELLPDKKQAEYRKQFGIFTRDGTFEVEVENDNEEDARKEAYQVWVTLPDPYDD